MESNNIDIDRMIRYNEMQNERLSALEGAAFLTNSNVGKLRSDNELMTLKIKKLEDRIQFVFDLLITLIIVLIVAVIIYITKIH
nr:MAG TPA: hemolysin [Caudoviricetes sp.]